MIWTPKILLSLLIVVGVSDAAKAGIIFQEDFEEQALGGPPEGWVVRYNDRFPIEVDVSDATAGRGARSLFFDDYDLRPQVGATVSFPSQSEGLYLLRGMIRAEQTDSTIITMSLRGPGLIIYNSFLLGRDGTFIYTDGFSNRIDSGVPYEAQRWYELSFLIDLQSNRWGVAVTDDEGRELMSVEGIRFLTTQPSSFDQLNFVGALANGFPPVHATGQWYIDDISLRRIPEPAGLLYVLSAIGIFGLTSYSHRRRTFR